MRGETTWHGRPKDVLATIKIGEIYTEIYEAGTDLCVPGNQQQIDYLNGLYEHRVQAGALYVRMWVPPTAIDLLREAIARGNPYMKPPTKTKETA